MGPISEHFAGHCCANAYNFFNTFPQIWELLGNGSTWPFCPLLSDVLTLVSVWRTPSSANFTEFSGHCNDCIGMNAPGLYIQYLVDILLQHISWKLFDAGIDGAFEFCCAYQKEMKCNQLISSCGGILPIYPGAPILTLFTSR